jgi:ABC-2 type transport system permease protein
VNAVRTLIRRELGAYFGSPVAYVFLVIFLLLAGFFTFTAGNFFERGEASLAAFFGWHPWIYLVVIPAIGMRL